MGKNTLMDHGEPSSLKDGSALNIYESSKPRLGMCCLEYAGKEIMRLITTLLSSAFLVSGTSSSATGQQGKIKAPFDEWYFTFSTPKALPAQVTLVKLIDVNGYGKVF
ncbi:hypothetical protein ACF5F1_002262 [Salmonella enterica]